MNNRRSTYVFPPELMEAARTVNAHSTAHGSKALAKSRPPSSPDRVYAHYNTLTGDARIRFYEQNKEALWAHYSARLKNRFTKEEADRAVADAVASERTAINAEIAALKAENAAAIAARHAAEIAARNATVAAQQETIRRLEAELQFLVDAKRLGVAPWQLEYARQFGISDEVLALAAKADAADAAKSK